MEFWLTLGGLAVYRTLTEDVDLFLVVVFLLTVVLKLVALLASCRTALRGERRPSPDGDAGWAAGEP
jgi:hypothetical protein